MAQPSTNLVWQVGRHRKSLTGNHNWQASTPGGLNRAAGDSGELPPLMGMEGLDRP